MKIIANRSVYQRIPSEEFDFRGVPESELAACAHFEYAREVSVIVECYAPGERAVSERVKSGMQNCPILLSLPMHFQGQPNPFRTAWLKQKSAWKESVVKEFASMRKGLPYARLIEATENYAFHVKFSTHFCFREWTEEHTRLPDRRTGIEGLLVTINWGSFSDEQIVTAFKKWVRSQEGRPRGMGERSGRGKRQLLWRTKLERLGVMRLRHHHPVSEVVSILQGLGNAKAKFSDEKELSRDRRLALKHMHELFPFLPRATKPHSWRMRSGGTK